MRSMSQVPFSNDYGPDEMAIRYDQLGWLIRHHYSKKAISARIDKIHEMRQKLSRATALISGRNMDKALRELDKVRAEVNLL